MTRICAAAALVAGTAIGPAITAVQKMTPEELVKLHVSEGSQQLDVPLVSDSRVTP